ncbi:Poly(beta-D-mannuronate) C5 epimerase 4 [Micromonospora sp. MW-13]|uniref:glycosyl hydrolase family 28-related protein n=1 Tax=Micromonospora sp. MW-13 TaxID=2094022 RepID=UPI000E436F51|nr:glycosyl hydrolase family 28-related protein [Micromonospora sp. MW-13]RGC69815.1 Poly(beta-D-mannuronate) C5 epimerase 4 [Micromonospora sp. MW-13]
MAHGDPDGPSGTSGVSRRSALLRGGAVAAGLGTAAVGVAAMGPWSSDGSGGQGVVDVREHGARGDGRSDDTAPLQRAIDAAGRAGGIVFFPPGTYLTGRLTLRSRVHLRGSGGDATVLRLRAGANSAIVESDGFSRLAGTRSDQGITLFSVRDLTLDGNKEQNPSAGYGLRVYGYGYELSEVIVFNCRNDGIVSEWGPAGALPAPSHQMEARLSAVRTHGNDGHGINFHGPHDSMFINCLTFENGASGFRLAGDSMGTSMVNCHAWGIKQNVSFDLAATGISCSSCYADLNGGVGVRISRNDIRWIGGLVLGYNHTDPHPEIGIQFVPGVQPEEPSGCLVDSKVVNCGTAAVDFGAERGLSSVRVSLSQPGAVDADGRRIPGTGRGWIGTPAPTTLVEITQGLGHPDKNLVVRPAFDLRAEAEPGRPGDGSVRVFARDVGGRTQLCALFPSGAVQVLATEP